MILLESIDLYEVLAVMKINSDFNKVDIFNKIRAIKDIVTVKVIKNSQLENMSKDGVEYALLKIKFLTSIDPLQKIEDFQNKIMRSGDDTDKILGVLNVAFKEDELKKLDKL